MYKCLTICHLNSRYIFAYNLSLKLVEFLAASDLNGFGVISVTETWLDSSASNSFRLPGFCTPLRFDQNRHGSGVLAYVKCNIFLSAWTGFRRFRH